MKIKETFHKRQLAIAVILTAILVSSITFSATWLYAGGSISSPGTTYGPGDVDGYSFVVFKEGSSYYGKNGTTRVLDYSSTNASYVLQNCNNALNVTGGGSIVIVSDLTLSGRVLVSDNVHWWGLGKEATTITAGNNMDSVMFYGDKVASGSGNDDIGFHYLGFDGNTAGQTSPQNLVTISNADNSIIEHCKFTNVGKHAILWSQGASGQWADNNQFIYNDIDATNVGKNDIDTLGLGYWRYGEVAYNYISANPLDSVVLVARAPMYTSYHHNTIVNGYSNGLKFESAWYIDVHDNKLLNCGNGIGIANNTVGFSVNGFPSHNSIVNNYVNLTTYDTGITSVGDYCEIGFNHVGYANRSGIYVYGDGNNVFNNHVWNNDQSNNGRYGISVVAGDYNKISYNHVWDNQAVPTHDNAIATLTLSNYTEITFNNMSGSAGAELKLNGDVNFVRFNIGYVTENNGNATVATGANVNHGLAGVPTLIQLTAGEAGPTDIYTSNVGAVTFRINFGGGGNKLFYWHVEYEP